MVMTAAAVRSKRELDCQCSTEQQAQSKLNGACATSTAQPRHLSEHESGSAHPVCQRCLNEAHFVYEILPPATRLLVCHGARRVRHGVPLLRLRPLKLLQATQLRFRLRRQRRPHGAGAVLLDVLDVVIQIPPIVYRAVARGGSAEGRGENRLRETEIGAYRLSTGGVYAPLARGERAGKTG